MNLKQNQVYCAFGHMIETKWKTNIYRGKSEIRRAEGGDWLIKVKMTKQSCLGSYHSLVYKCMLRLMQLENRFVFDFEYTGVMFFGLSCSRCL